MQQQSVSKDISERQQINATLQSFLDLPVWTPAMGAVLISGVLPAPGCKKIPEVAASLKDAATPATASELRDAGRVLKRWRECHLEVDSAGAEDIGSLPSEVALFDFFLWCEEEYRGELQSNKPAWLDYWFSNIGWSERPNVPAPAPADLVERSAQLEGVVAVLRAHPPETDVRLANAPSVPAVGLYVAKMTKIIEERSRSPIADQLIAALRSSDDPHRPRAVWLRLCEMAKSGTQSVLRYEDETTLNIPGEKTPWKPYKESDLKQFLYRYSKEVERSSSKRGKTRG